VLAVVVEVCAFADDLRCAASEGRLGEDTAYLGIRRGEADGPGGKLEGLLHEDFVLGERSVIRHISRISVSCLWCLGSHRRRVFNMQDISLQRLIGGDQLNLALTPRSLKEQPARTTQA
jgi:hypothetical protein